MKTRRRNIITARSYQRSPLVPLSVERWMPVTGWEDFYQVSNQHRVRSLDRLVIEKSGKVRHSAGRVLVPSRDAHPQVTLSAAGRRRCCYVNVLVREAFGSNSQPARNALQATNNR
jgi:hypothetical protein